MGPLETGEGAMTDAGWVAEISKMYGLGRKMNS
jgi:hypothetical protein